MSEVWRPVEGYRYEVSDRGRVRVSNGKVLGSFVKGCITRRSVTLYNEWGPQTFGIQELVIGAFMEPATDDQVICFGENGPNDASLSNLEYQYKEMMSGEPC